MCSIKSFYQPEFYQNHSRKMLFPDHSYEPDVYNQDPYASPTKLTKIVDLSENESKYIVIGCEHAEDEEIIYVKNEWGILCKQRKESLGTKSPVFQQTSEVVEIENKHQDSALKKTLKASKNISQSIAQQTFRNCRVAEQLLAEINSLKSEDINYNNLFSEATTETLNSKYSKVSSNIPDSIQTNQDYFEPPFLINGKNMSNSTFAEQLLENLENMDDSLTDSTASHIIPRLEGMLDEAAESIEPWIPMNSRININIAELKSNVKSDEIPWQNIQEASTFKAPNKIGICPPPSADPRLAPGYGRPIPRPAVHFLERQFQPEINKNQSNERRLIF